MTSSKPTSPKLPAELAPGQLMILRILWGAFITTQALFALISVLVPAPTADAAQAMALLPIFAALALFMAGASLFGAPMLAAKTAMDYTTMSLLRFALAESLGIFGLMLGMMGLDLAYVFAFSAASAAVLLVQLPSDTGYQRYRDDALRQRR